MRLNVRVLVESAASFMHEEQRKSSDRKRPSTVLVWQSRSSLDRFTSFTDQIMDAETKKTLLAVWAFHLVDT